MRFFINRLIINGAKSIDKPIELAFSNKTLKANDEFENSNVKAIYGPNGSGKSGLMSAVYIYKRLIDDVDGINDRYFSKLIFETINKETKELSIDVIFSILDKTNNCYKHSIVLAAEDEIVSIKKEEVLILKGNVINDENFRRLILIENGIIKEMKGDKGHDLTSEPLYINSLNLLNKHSITSAMWKIIKIDINEKYVGNLEVINALIDILLLSSELVVELNKEDMHNDYISNRLKEKKYDSEEKVSKFFEKIIESLSPSEYLVDLSTIGRDKVKVDELPMYEKNIKKLTDFLRIFKPDLDEIIIDKKENDKEYYCDKIFRYGNKKINVEFESTGIKKLMRLYSILKSCANGSVAFIDEMDANLHDVYFTKLIEFFKNDSKGQLCFTTHNLEPIDILKENSHSLDFISNDSRVYSWIKDGNKSPMKKYISGLIPYSPFNVESFDFDLLLDEE